LALFNGNKSGFFAPELFNFGGFHFDLGLSFSVGVVPPMLTTLIAHFRFATQKEKNLHLFVRHLLQVAFSRLLISSFICAKKTTATA